MKRPL